MSKTRYFTYTMLLVLLAAFCLGCATPEEEEMPAETEMEEEEMPAETEMEEEEMPAEPGMEEEEMPAEPGMEEDMPAEPGMEEPVLTGVDVYRYVTEENDYTAWPLFPGKAALSTGTSPHGALVTIYVSDEALTAIEAKSGMMPSGSTVVKENYNPEAELVAVTLMHKVEGFDPEHNDWYWLKYGPNGSIDAEGKVGSCINCHAASADNDFIFTGELS